MRLTVDLLRAADGRLEGTVISESGREQPFSGTLELLRVLEDLQLEYRHLKYRDDDRRPR